MKEKILHNLNIKIIAFCAAFIVWLAVVNIANPVITVTRDVDVQITNEEVLEKSNLTYEVVGKSTATVSCRARTRDASRIKASDFYVYADLSDMYDVTGSIPIQVEIVSNEDLIQGTPTVSPGVIKIQTEPLQTKEFTLNAITTGEVESGYELGEITLDPETAVVKGPQSMVGQISSVGVEINVDGAAEDFSGTAEPGFYDANGNEITMSEQVQIEGGEVAYSVNILRLKEVPLNFIVAGNVAQGYKYAGAEATVASVTIAGESSDLESISEIRIQNPTLNVEGATEDVTTTVDLNDYLPTGVTLSGMDNSVINVTLKVEPLETERYTVSGSSVSLIGEQTSYDYSVNTESVTVRIEGLAEDLAQISSSDLTLSADVSDLGDGTYTVPVTVTINSDNSDLYEVVGTSSFSVTVSARDQQATTETETESATETTEETESESTTEGGTTGT